MKVSLRAARYSVAVGLGCVLLVLGWQYLTVRVNYGGAWTALFCTGEALKTPPQLAGENIYRFRASQGYDGQFYHYIAHDPFFDHGLADYIDAPRLRYRRILIPLSAHLLALGQDTWIDAAYILVNLGAIFCGVYWLARYASARSLSPAWGAAFLIVPATLVSIDRLTIDAALAALCVAFMLYVSHSSPAAIWTLLAAAGLVRETGVLLAAACCAYLLLEARFRASLYPATAVLPAAAWFWYVHLRTDSAGVTWLDPVPLTGIAHRLLNPVPYSLDPAVSAVATALDYAALAGILVAIALAARLAARRQTGPGAIAVYLFAMQALFLSRADLWADAYGFGRVLSPLLLMLAMLAVEQRSPVYAAPLLLVTPRVLLQLGPQISGIVGSVFRAG